jgi:hypothetical protein
MTRIKLRVKREEKRMWGSEWKADRAKALRAVVARCDEAKEKREDSADTTKVTRCFWKRNRGDSRLPRGLRKCSGSICWQLRAFPQILWAAWLAAIGPRSRAGVKHTPCCPRAWGHMKAEWYLCLSARWPGHALPQPRQANPRCKEGQQGRRGGDGE